MEFRQLHTFIQAAQLQSFSRAAVQLGYSQSAVTVQIRMLEKELGTRLFDRMGKQVVLTPQGQKFLTHANTILYEVNRTRLSMHEDEELKNPLHIGTIESLCAAKLPAIVSRFPGTSSTGKASDHGGNPGRADSHDGARSAGYHLHSGCAQVE